MRLQDIYRDNLVLSEEQIAADEELTTQIQSRLNHLLIPVGNVDGIYGKRTDAGVERFCKIYYLDCPVTNKYGRFFAEKMIEAQRSPQSLLPDYDGKGGVDGFRDALCLEADKQGLKLLTHKAYLLATAQHETAGTYQPVEEGFYLPNPKAFQKTLRYYPFYGRGDVQLTWEFNYRYYADILDLPLVDKPELVLRPNISLFVLVHGCRNGVFTGHSLAEFINGAKRDYYRARKVVNGLDRAKHVEGLAIEWHQKLKKVYGDR